MFRQVRTMPENVCDCGRVIEQPATGRKRKRCKVCSPPEKKPPKVGDSRLVILPSRDAARDAGQPDRPTIAASTLSDLRLVDRHQTTAGITALHLAELLDAGGYNAQGAASLVKAHREALAVALEGTQANADVIDAIFGAG